MDTILLILTGVVIYLLYLIIDFAIPIVLIYLLITHPYNITLWVWAILLIIWFVARMIVYVNKEIKKNDK